MAHQWIHPVWIRMRCSLSILPQVDWWLTDGRCFRELVGTEVRWNPDEEVSPFMKQCFVHSHHPESTSPCFPQSSLNWGTIIDYIHHCFLYLLKLHDIPIIWGPIPLTKIDCCFFFWSWSSEKPCAGRAFRWLLQPTNGCYRSLHDGSLFWCTAAHFQMF